MAITAIRVRLEGQVGADAVRMEVAGTSVPFDEHGRFSISKVVDADARNIAITSIDAEGERTTRTIRVSHTNVVLGATS